MEDQGETSGTTRQGSSERSEPVRSRWTPKPEQILILESIFNSGTVNPPKDETVRIRKLLEKFGSVGDANVFYWFQNRRSRSRRRQRQIQAGLLNTTTSSSSLNYHAQTSSSIPPPPQASAGIVPPFEQYTSCFSSSPSTMGNSDHDHFSFSHQMGLSDIDQSSIMCSDISSLNYQPAGSVIVFINGIATDVPSGPFDIRAMFGQDVTLVHSSGIPVPISNYGTLLQMGESYFLVSGST